jgi:hypothetical protein
MRAQSHAREQRNYAAERDDEKRWGAMFLSFRKKTPGALEAMFQNGTFVILRPALASRILLLEDIPP